MDGLDIKVANLRELEAAISLLKGVSMDFQDGHNSLSRGRGSYHNKWKENALARVLVKIWCVCPDCPHYSQIWS